MARAERGTGLNGSKRKMVEKGRGKSWHGKRGEERGEERGRIGGRKAMGRENNRTGWIKNSREAEGGRGDMAREESQRGEERGSRRGRKATGREKRKEQNGR